MTQPCSIEQLKVVGEDVLKRVERIVHEGNVRRIIIRQEGRSVAEFPLTVGVVGAAFAPVLAAIGFLVAELAHCTLEIERMEERDEARFYSQHVGLDGIHWELDQALRGEPMTRH